MDRLLDFSEYMKSCPRTKTTTNWWQLLPTHSIKLEEEYQKPLLDEALSEAGSYTELAKRTRLHRKAISAFVSLKKTPSVGGLKAILSFLGRNPKEANGRILELAGIRSPKLPFDIGNPQGAEITAAFLSDGHLPKIPFKNPMYCALEEELHLRLIKLTQHVFGDFSPQIKPGHKSPLTRFPCPIGTSLERAGVPRGDKRRKNPFIPRHILLGNEQMQINYVRRVFDDEGDVCISNIKRAVRLTRSTDAGDLYASTELEKQRWIYGDINSPTNNLITGECLLLRKLGIDAKLYREGIYRSANGRTTAKWRIQIAQQDNLKRFAEKIGFNHSEKSRKLAIAISSFKKKKSPNGFTEKIVLEHVLRMSRKKDTISFKDIGDKLVALGMDYDSAGRFLKTFIKKNVLVKVKRGAYIVKRND